MRLGTLDTEWDGLLDELTKPHCFVVKAFKEDRWFIFCDLEQMPDHYREKLLSEINCTFHGFEDFEKIIFENFDGLICHNLYGYDMPAFEIGGYIDSFQVGPDQINGKDFRLIDSLTMSRTLNPDRLLPLGCPAKIMNPVTGKMDKTVGPHGLEAWGYRVANMKPQVDDWRNQPIHVYINRCIGDVKINELTYIDLLEEKAKDDWFKKWDKPLTRRSKIDYLNMRRSRTGVYFDREYGAKVLAMLLKDLEELENFVEPRLPERLLPKSKQPKFPANPFKKDKVTLSNSGYRWLERLGYEIHKKHVPSKSGRGAGTYVDALVDETLFDKAMADINNKKQIVLTEPMRLSNLADIKLFLFREGWVPTMWSTKDITRKDKRNLPKAEVKEKAEKYLKDVRASPYATGICDELELDLMDDMCDEALLDDIAKKGRYLPSSPALKDKVTKVLCSNLEKMEGEMAKAIVKYLSLSNRRSVLKAKDEEKTGGWLQNPRLEVDSRLSADSSGITNTHRQKHRVVANVPKASPDVLYGKEFRSLFTATPGHLCCGFDASALEAICEGANTYKYDEGEYAKELTDGDVHTKNMLAWRIYKPDMTRSDAKAPKYGITYGAQGAKMEKMLGLPKGTGKAFVDDFWKKNWSLNKCKKFLEKQWKMNGKRFIEGLDGSKIFTRSQHSLVNAKFQSDGAIIMDTAYCFFDLWINKYNKENNTKYTSTIYYHDELKVDYLEEDLKPYKVFETEEEAKEFDKNLEDGRILSQPMPYEGQWCRYYHIVGDLGVKAIRKAGEHYGYPVKLDAEYAIGRSWAEVH